MISAVASLPIFSIFISYRKTFMCLIYNRNEMTYIKQVKDSQTIVENVEGKREIHV